VRGIGVSGHAHAVAERQAEGARAHTAAALLASGAHHAAGPAVGVVAIGIHARTAAADLLAGAPRGRAHPEIAGLARGASLSAGAAVLEVGKHVDANAVAVGQVRRAGARALHALLAAATRLAARAAVQKIALNVDTRARAIDQRLGAAGRAHARTADLRGVTGGAAGSTVHRIGSEIDTACRAGVHSGRAHASASAADLVRPAGSAASRAIVMVALQIHTTVAALRQRRSARRLADPELADLPVCAGLVAASAMDSARLRIDADSATKEESGWTDRPALALGDVRNCVGDRCILARHAALPRDSARPRTASLSRASGSTALSCGRQRDINVAAAGVQSGDEERQCSKAREDKTGASSHGGHDCKSYAARTNRETSGRFLRSAAIRVVADQGSAVGPATAPPVYSLARFCGVNVESAIPALTCTRSSFSTVYLPAL